MPTNFSRVWLIFEYVLFQRGYFPAQCDTLAAALYQNAWERKALKRLCAERPWLLQKVAVSDL